MQAGLSYVCYQCNQIMERAPHGECVYCASENIMSVSSLMYEPRNVARAMNPLRKLDKNAMPLRGGRLPLVEKL